MESQKTRQRTPSYMAKVHLAVDSKTHEIICADLSLNNVTDSEAFPGLIRQTHRKIRAASADGAYDTRLCHDELRRKKISALIPPRKGAGYWPGEYADRNRAVANQRMTGSNARWKWTTDGTVAKLAMRQPFVLFKGLTFQKLCLPGAFRPGDHHNKMLRPGLCVVHASPQYL
ncbi:transposase [Klebsiella pneumoniae]|uniref:transposase n=2 Tax=Klebsiella pneumoniae TaxID=573 RepID=UPI00388E1223